MQLMMHGRPSLWQIVAASFGLGLRVAAGQLPALKQPPMFLAGLQLGIVHGSGCGSSMVELRMRRAITRCRTWVASGLHRVMQHLSQWAVFGIELCQQELLWDAAAVHVAQGFVPCGESDFPGLEPLPTPPSGDSWKPATALCSKLPADWGQAAAVQSVAGAWYDLQHFDAALAATYQGHGDDDWLELIQQNLLSGETFRSGSLSRQADVWEAYSQMTGIAGAPLVDKVLGWVRHGYNLSFVLPFADAQQLHPHYEQRLVRVRRALTAVVGAAEVERYLTCPEPLPVTFPNNLSCTEHCEFVRSELQAFLGVNALERWDPAVHGPAVVHPMSVVVHPWSGKHRLCIDANYVNVFEKYEPVQFELLPDVFPLIQPGDWGYVTDCTKGYFHLQLHPMARRFLAVQFDGVTYVFRALPFGLSSAVKAFTDTMTVAYMPMRRQGMRFSSMIDDRIGLAKSKMACWLDIYIVVRFVCGLGFHLGLAKSVLWPQQQLLYLGLLLRLDTLQCLVPVTKLQKFDQTIQGALTAPALSARQLATVAGQLISLSLAVPLGKLYTRQLFLALSHKISWDQALPVGPELTAHLRWMRQYVPAHNGSRWFRRQPGVLLVTDASVKGVGGLASVGSSGVQVALQGQLPEPLFLASSTCREAAGMVALLETLLQRPQWVDLLQHRAVKILTDNQGVASDVQRMKGCPSVFAHVKRLYEFAARHDFDLMVEWRPREYELLQFADLHSKMVDVSDWGLTPAAYTALRQQFNCQPAVDWFARPWSAKCPRFYCRFLMLGCAGVDAFDFCWALPAGALSYICPPHMLVAKVVRKVLDEQASCVLVLPAWYKCWHAMLGLLPVRGTLKLPASAVIWGDRAPAPHVRCHALLAGLQAYYVVF
eukprot:GHRQ01001010.1.p1 GENE.GHRQ01001010.1~~GHRQ01001010.1.p1  ORF type:complete len:881 (+),score=141.58 GHRQ01001010.1:1178-3820(+)